MRSWMRLVLVLNLISTTLFVCGCAGTNEADLRRRSRPRPKEEEAAPPPQTAAAPAATPAATETAQTPAATTPTPATAPAGTPPATAAVAQPATAGNKPPATAAATPPTAGSSGALDPELENLRPLLAKNAAPAQPLTDAQQWQRNVNNLQKIAQALKKMEGSTEAWPCSCIPRGEVSWRVQLLPYLGYKELYDHFNLNEPWDSPRNQRLLQFIPPEYQCPARLDQSTNYLLVTGKNSCFDNPTNGPENSVKVIEGGDALAVPWTQPMDFDNQTAPQDFQFGTSPQGALVILGNGDVRFAPTSVTADIWQNLFVSQSGNKFDASNVLLAANARSIPRAASPAPEQVATEDVVSNTPGPVPASNMTATNVPVTNTVPNATPAPMPEPPKNQLLTKYFPFLAEQSDDVRETMPPVDDQKIIGDTLKTLYRDDYEMARKEGKLNLFTSKLLEQTVRIKDDSKASYVMNDLVRKLAIGQGDVPTAMTAVNNLVERFKVDGCQLKYDTLNQLSELVTRNGPVNIAVAQHASALLDEAIAQDKLELAIQANELIKAAAKRAMDKRRVEQATQERAELEVAKQMQADALAAIETLTQDPENVAANETLGMYLTLVKQDFIEGLPFLAKGDDVHWKLIASIDIDPHKSATNTIALADQWWSMAESLKNPMRRACHLRAVHWYHEAIPQMQNNLQRVTAEAKVREAEKMYPQIVAATRPQTPTDSNDE